MTTKRVLLAGDAAFVNALQGLCQKGGHSVSAYYAQDLDQQAVLDKLVAEAATSDIFIESLNESASSKAWLVEGIEANLRPTSLLLTHPLSASTTEVASWCANPRRVVGFGFLPSVKTPPGPPIVEFVPALQTDVASAASAREFWERLGAEVVRVADGPCLVRARLLFALINEAVFALESKVASAEDIDTAYRLAQNLPRGPLAWADELGLEVVLGGLTALYDATSEERYRVAPLLRQKVRAGHLGRRVGQGFFLDPLIAPT
jgi:3-hydroxybutyryl-CoA dehydrogenase